MTLQNYKKDNLFNMIYTCFAVFMTVIVILNLIKGELKYALIASIVLLSMFFLQFIINKLNIVFIPTFKIGIAIFLFSSIYLGEMKNFYYKFWWWDLALHFYSGFFMVLFSVYIIGIINVKLNKSYIYNPLLVVIICLFISISFESFWEVFEFIGDKVFNTNMEKSGLQDSMTDFIMNILGSIAACLLVYLKRKNIISTLFKVTSKP